MVDIEYDGLQPEIAMYIKRIGDIRDAGKHGRAVQLVDKALEKNPDPMILNVLLNFKADSLHKVGVRVQSIDLVQEARTYYIEVLQADPNDHVARMGLEEIDFYR